LLGEPTTEAPELGGELTVTPIDAILPGAPFGARFSGRVVFDAEFLNDANALLGAGEEDLEIRRLAITKLQATVHVRKGATGDDVVLTPVSFTPAPSETCSYDDNGNTGAEAGPFPKCSRANDNPDDGSNADCTGLGNMPDPENPCLPFVVLPTSDDCDEGGECDDLGEWGPGSPCELNGFCITEELAIELEGDQTSDGYIYRAEPSGSVFFGWDDQEDPQTGRAILESGPNKGTWILPVARSFEAPLGSTGLRMVIGSSTPSLALRQLAWECTMGVISRGPNGVDSADALSSPAPDHLLVSFPIRQR